MQWLRSKSKGRSLEEDNALLRALLAKEQQQRMEAQERLQNEQVKAALLERELFQAAQAAHELGESLCVYLVPAAATPATCPAAVPVTSKLPPASNSTAADKDRTSDTPGRLGARDALRSAADTLKQQQAAAACAVAAASTPPVTHIRRQQELQDLAHRLKGMAAAWKQRLETYYDAGLLEVAMPCNQLLEAVPEHQDDDTAAPAAETNADAAADEQQQASTCSPASTERSGCSGSRSSASPQLSCHSGSPSPRRDLSQLMEQAQPGLRSSDEDCYDTYPPDCQLPAAGGRSGARSASSYQHELELHLQAIHGTDVSYAKQQPGQLLQAAPRLLSCRVPAAGASSRPAAPLPPHPHWQQQELRDSAAARGGLQPRRSYSSFSSQLRQSGQADSLQTPVIPQTPSDWMPLTKGLIAQSSTRSMHSSACTLDMTPLDLLHQHQERASVVRASLQSSRSRSRAGGGAATGPRGRSAGGYSELAGGGATGLRVRSAGGSSELAGRSYRYSKALAQLALHDDLDCVLHGSTSASSSVILGLSPRQAAVNSAPPAWGRSR